MCLRKCSSRLRNKRASLSLERGVQASRSFLVYEDLGRLACNLLLSLKILGLPDDAQSWRIRILIGYLLTVPVTVSSHTRCKVARICIPAGWLRWRWLFVDKWVPKRNPGRPAMEVVGSA